MLIYVDAADRTADWGYSVVKPPKEELKRRPGREMLMVPRKLVKQVSEWDEGPCPPDVADWMMTAQPVSLKEAEKWYRAHRWV